MILRRVNALGTWGQREVKPSANLQLLSLSTQMFLIKKNLRFKGPKLIFCAALLMQIRALSLSLFLLQTCVHIYITLLLVNYVKACAILVSALWRGNDIFSRPISCAEPECCLFFLSWAMRGQGTLRRCLGISLASFFFLPLSHQSLCPESHLCRALHPSASLHPCP